MVIISIDCLLGNMKLKQIKQTGQPDEMGTLHCSQEAAGAITTPLDLTGTPAAHPQFAALMKRSSLPCPYPNALMLPRLPSHYLSVYLRACELANHGPHEAHTCVLLGPQGLNKTKQNKTQIGCQCLKTRRFHIKIQISGFT